ncbi:phage major capsid protein [Adlercreutzia muris]|uniref:Phage major capsid protein n=1 Tax=Adlercreutzia muris TaxID=1796610 RepID=A0A7C8BRH6_9ACTN|nr:phage major capsid protein [Adlercreutzia muris]KAB1647987.1 phage major capsid protein [Adlercreutzia muris]MCR2027720.1 phage major capsid protein [Adlercreutzia muris]
MTIKFANMEACERLSDAMLANEADPEALALAWASYGESIANELRGEFAQYGRDIDAKAMESRGYRVLTANETAWYEKVIQAVKTAKTKQAFIEIIGTGDQDSLMPPTIIQDVFSDIQKDSPLLAAVSAQYVGYAQNFIVNDAAIQMGAWGEITAEIVKEIKGAIKVISMSQSRYTAFCIIPLDILDMGPQFVDAFIRSLMAESMRYGLEAAVVNGSGVNMPVGMMRNPDGAFEQETGYPEKDAVKLTSFAPDEYGVLLSKLAKTRTGRERAFDEVCLITNMTDYLTKVMPATTVQATVGGYVSNVFPFATKIIRSSAVPEGKAIIGLLDKYRLGIGGSRNGIEFDDSFKFLEDCRTFKAIQHAGGRAYDNTCFVVVDITDLDPAYITVRNVDAVPSV